MDSDEPAVKTESTFIGETRDFISSHFSYSLIRACSGRFSRTCIILWLAALLPPLVSEIEQYVLRLAEFDVPSSKDWAYWGAQFVLVPLAYFFGLWFYKCWKDLPVFSAEHSVQEGVTQRTQIFAYRVTLLLLQIAPYFFIPTCIISAATYRGEARHWLWTNYWFTYAGLFYWCIYVPWLCADLICFVLNWVLAFRSVKRKILTLDRRNLVLLHPDGVGGYGQLMTVIAAPLVIFVVIAASLLLGIAFNAHQDPDYLNSRLGFSTFLMYIFFFAATCLIPLLDSGLLHRWNSARTSVLVERASAIQLLLEKGVDCSSEIEQFETLRRSIPIVPLGRLYPVLIQIGYVLAAMFGAIQAIGIWN